jgi:hypothetical protein
MRPILLIGLLPAFAFSGCASFFYRVGEGDGRVVAVETTAPLVAVTRSSWFNSDAPGWEKFLFEITPLGFIAPIFGYPPKSQSFEGSAALSIFPSAAADPKDLKFNFSVVPGGVFSKTLRFNGRESGVRFDPESIVLEMRCGGKWGPTCSITATPAVLDAKGVIRLKSEALNPPHLTTNVTFSGQNNVLQAGEPGELIIKIANAGPGKAMGVKLALSDPGIPYLGLLSTVGIGNIEAHQTVSREIEIVSLEETPPGRAKITLTASEEYGFDAAPVEISFPVRAMLTPRLEASGISVAGGMVRSGEINHLSVMVSNEGRGAAKDVAAHFHLNPGIFPAGSLDAAIGDLRPGESKKVAMDFLVNNQFKRGQKIGVGLSLSEARSHYSIANHSLGLVVGKAPTTSKVTITGEPEPDDVDDPPHVQTPIDPDAVGLVIGIENYRQSRIPTVDFAAADAETMYGYLTKSMGYDPKNVVLLRDEQATKGDLEKYLGAWLQNHTTARSRVFIYFAGHGAPLPASGERFLVPYEADPNYLKETAYPLSRLYSTLGRLPAKRVLVVLDSCFSGAGGRSVIAKGVRPLVAIQETGSIPKNTTVLAAAQASEISASYPEARHGLLTYFLLKGLHGAAERGRAREITTQDLFDYLRPAVERQARKQNVEQMPVLLSDPREKSGQEVWVKLR